jgi:hypothetical protein
MPGETGLDTVMPVTGWFMFETKSKDEINKEKEAAKEAQREHYRRLFGRDIFEGMESEEAEDLLE